tara:strand:- start:82 stop:288 length:207 start_codon:yes stop_codon:yes gene_type:complete
MSFNELTRVTSSYLARTTKNTTASKYEKLATHNIMTALKLWYLVLNIELIQIHYHVSHALNLPIICTL